MLLRILDIDLDFFLNRRETHVPVTSIERLSEDVYQSWPSENVANFLEKRCGLSSENKITGEYFIHHDEVFYYLRELQEQSNFTLTFSIDHVDAHADVGKGDASYKYIFSELLHLPLMERCYPQKRNGYEGLSAGNFLAFAIACRWVKNINYITNTQWQDDLHFPLFKDFDERGNLIQLKKYSPAQMNSITNCANIKEKMAETLPLELEPEVEMRRIDFNAFKSDGNYDMIFLTQSPGYTPETSDKLIPVIRSYMDIKST